MTIHPMEGYVVLKAVKEDVEKDIKSGTFIHAVPSSSLYADFLGAEVLAIECNGVIKKIGRQIYYIVPEAAIIAMISEDKETGEKIVGRIPSNQEVEDA